MSPKRQIARRSWLVGAFLGLAAVLALALPGRADEPKKPDPNKKAETYKVPYQLTDTKHILIRVKVNGKGPFNFIVDTGAPALFVGTEAAKKMGIEPDKNGWGTFENFEIEGGIKMENVKGRIEDPFQLVGMNKMNLPGIRYDGMMGYTILAKYRITYDFTQPHLIWTKLDWDPPMPMGLAELGGKAPAEFDAMGGLVKFAAALLGRRPDAELIYKGFLGLELVDGNTGVFFSKVLPNSPAAEAGLKEKDRLTKFQDKDVESVAQVQKLSTEAAAERDIRVEVERDGKKITATIKTIQGL